MVYEKITRQPLGTVYDVLVHPEQYTIEGFFIRTSSLTGYSVNFFLTSDVYSIGTAITVSSSQAIGAIEDFARVQPFITNPRPLYYGKVYSAQKKRLGTVYDIQFTTSTFECTWFYVKHWWKKQTLSCSSIDVITPDGVFLKDSTLPVGLESLEITDAVQDVLQAELPVVANN